MARQKTQEKRDTLATETLLEWYSRMALIRRFEDVAEQGYQEGKIAGYHHVYSGQEAVAVGTFAHLGAEDHIVTAYRDHGPALARGMDANRAMAELYGRATGTSGGKGGSMHLADRELHFWGGYAIVAGHLPIATGIALADQYRDIASVTVCMFGDGSTNNGYFHEALNLAAVWKLPVLFLCENNLYGMWTAFEEVSAVANTYKKACAYDIPAKQIDGMNVLEVYEQMADPIERIRAGEGPQYVEALTYRYRGHGAGDIEAYRSKEEVAEYREKDPINQLGAYLVEQREIDEEKLESLREEAHERVEAARKFADESPEPEIDAIWQDIFKKPFDTMSPSQGRS